MNWAWNYLWSPSQAAGLCLEFYRALSPVGIWPWPGLKVTSFGLCQAAQVCRWPTNTPTDPGMMTTEWTQGLLSQPHLSQTSMRMRYTELENSESSCCLGMGGSLGYCILLFLCDWLLDTHLLSPLPSSCCVLHGFQMLSATSHAFLSSLKTCPATCHNAVSHPPAGS
jgi:hypothetical protein